jgi:hypothetical protein
MSKTNKKLYMCMFYTESVAGELLRKESPALASGLLLSRVEVAVTVSCRNIASFFSCVIWTCPILLFPPTPKKGTCSFVAM